MKHRLSCGDFINSGLPNDGCCDSCHEDDEWGYEMCYLKPEGRTRTDAYVCCAISCAVNDIDMPLRKVFAIALQAHREKMRTP